MMRVKCLPVKEKLGICPYEKNDYEKEIIKINIEESFNKLLDESDDESIKELGKQINKESDDELIKESDKEPDKESDKESNKESDKESNKESSDEKLIEIINPKKDEDTTDWYDKNKFKKILTPIKINS